MSTWQEPFCLEGAAGGLGKAPWCSPQFSLQSEWVPVVGGKQFHGPVLPQHKIRYSLSCIPAIPESTSLVP